MNGRTDLEVLIPPISLVAWCDLPTLLGPAARSRPLAE